MTKVVWGSGIRLAGSIVLAAAVSSCGNQVREGTASSYLIIASLEAYVNLAAPNPVPNAEFMRTLRAALGIPLGLPASGWMLEMGAAVLRTETELILKSRRVVPARLLEQGFSFRFPDWSDAANDLVRQRRD